MTRPVAYWHLVLWPPPWRRDNLLAKLAGWLYLVAIIPVCALISVFVLVTIPFQRWAARRSGPLLTRAAAANAIEAFLEHRDGPWAWDDFTTVHIGDPYLDAIRERCAQLDQEFPPAEPGQYCGTQGLELLRAYVRELRAETLDKNKV